MYKKLSTFTYLQLPLNRTKITTKIRRGLRLVHTIRKISKEVSLRLRSRRKEVCGWIVHLCRLMTPHDIDIKTFKRLSTRESLTNYYHPGYV